MSNESAGAKKAVCEKKGRLRETPIRYTIDLNKRIVTATFGGILTADVLCQYTKLLRQDPKFSASLSEIADITEVQEIQLSGEQLIRLADSIDPFSRAAKRAFIVRNAMQGHEARMYGILRLSRERIRAFHSCSEAERWILSDDNPR